MTDTPEVTDEPVFADFTAAHLDGAVRLSEAEHWPHRREDWALNLTISRGVVALSGAEVVGTALCSLMGGVASFNMIIVDARMRGRGLGRALMERLFALAGPRELRLVATEEGRPLYEKLGFRATGQVVQHQGIAQAAEAPGLPVELLPASDSAALETLIRMDHAATGLERSGLLREIATQDPGDTALLRSAQGMALLRRFGRGQVLGPVVARDRDDARALIAAAAGHVEGRFLRLDMPREHDLSDFVERLGLAHAGGGTLMAANACPEAEQPEDLTRFTLISQALG